MKTSLFTRWSNCLHWLSARKADGKGIHSPYLYRFITMVLNNPCSYYGLSKQAKQEPGDLALQKLLFGIVADLQPQHTILLGEHATTWQPLIQTASQQTKLQQLQWDELLDNRPIEKADLLVVSLEGSKNAAEHIHDLMRLYATEIGILVVLNPYHSVHRLKQWKALQKLTNAPVSIDLFYAGLLLLKPDLVPMQLKIHLNKPKR